MPRPKKNADADGQLDLLDARERSTTAPCVPAIRQAVAAWKAGGCKGVTPTTRTLLDYWFGSDHRLPNGRRFRYHDAQREAIETLIYLFEVAKVRRHAALIETYYRGAQNKNEVLKLLQYDDFARYCTKMATGSGKTKVMSLAVVWQYMNAVCGNDPDYARTFLILAPNVIVFERLKTDFAGAVIFNTDPLIPRELKLYWDVDCYLRGDGERATSEGALYLTNIQQLHGKVATDDDDGGDALNAMLGSVPPTKKIETVDFLERIASRGGTCLVLNDEAHHTHDEKLRWNEIIRDLHTALEAANGAVIQLDVTATPRHTKGGLFTWTVSDYPLKQAITDGIVKRPVKGITAGMQEVQSNIASTRYQAYLVAGVERWREYRDQLMPLRKKPILFVMMNSTAEADDVDDFLRRQYPEEFAGGDKLVTIHTNTSGEISKADLEAARELSRNVDKLDNPVNAIVSVLMLREGWDVQNVTVVVGLRPFNAKANILPEQAIGRGLRRMFYGDATTAYVERVDIIGSKGFIAFVDELEREENVTLDTFEPGKDKLVITTVMPDPAKADKDIRLPKLSPLLARKRSLADEIAAIDVSAMHCPRFPVKRNDATAQSFRYEGKDILTLETVVARDYEVPTPNTAQEVISYYAKRIAQDVRLPGQFAALAPKVREFLETRAFGGKVDIETPEMIRAISHGVAAYVTIKEFAKILRGAVIEEKVPVLESEGRFLSETNPFPFGKPTFAAHKTVYNLVAPDNAFEMRFARFLENAPDIERFAKLPSQFGFVIEYTDSAANMRYYEPDFVAVLTDETRFVVETKGREDIDVAHKDRAAALWCESATLLTGETWRYLKVPQGEFEKLEPCDFSDIGIFSVDS